MLYIYNKEFHNQGDICRLLTRPVDRKKPLLVAFVRMDRNKRCLVLSMGLIKKLRPYNRMQWNQNDPAPISDPNVVELIIPQPIKADLYYRKYGKIDRHNRFRQ